MSASTQSVVPTSRVRALCLCSYGGGVLLNLHHLAFWCAPVALMACLWCARSWRTGARAPPRILRAGIVAVLTVAVLLRFHTLNGVEAGATLLAAMGALKLLEAQRRRDWFIVTGVGVFLLLAAGLDRQALWRLPLYALELWLLCTAIHGLGTTTTQPVTALARSAGRGLLLALPLALLLFVAFPRLSGSFWALPRTDVAVSGLGNEINPGSISELSLSDDEALRVRFDGPLPPPAQRYWRGPVLSGFDGTTWRRARGPARAAPSLTYTGESYGYEVTLEPNDNNVLIALELPTGPPAAPPTAFFTPDHQLISTRPLDQRTSYRLTSYTQHTSGDELPAAVRRLDLSLPQARNPRSQRLGARLRAAATSDAGFIDSVLNYFRHGGFVYTLTPPTLGSDAVDDFLFNTHEGFCGHYASAFVTLMRAGGVPARVVTGYQGGEWNRFGHYLLVRQSDAHAWAEVWLSGRGWMRVDPTAVIAPGRLTRDVFDLLPVDIGVQRRLRAAPWIHAAVQAWDAANAWWQDQILGYTFNKQLHLLDYIGLSTIGSRALALLLGLGGLIWSMWLAWLLLAQRPSRDRDGCVRAWQQLERRLVRLGCVRAAHEGPIAFAMRASRRRPDLRSALMSLAQEYARLRYGRVPAAASQAAAMTRFRRAVRAFRPGRESPSAVSPGAATTHHQ